MAFPRIPDRMGGVGAIGIRVAGMAFATPRFRNTEIGPIPNRMLRAYRSLEPVDS